MNAYDIIRKPIITEQSMEAVEAKKYVFEVAKDAGKIEIKKAVEEIFGVKVAKVEVEDEIEEEEEQLSLPAPAAEEIPA